MTEDKMLVVALRVGRTVLGYLIPKTDLLERQRSKNSKLQIRRKSTDTLAQNCPSATNTRTQSFRSDANQKTTIEEQITTAEPPPISSTRQTQIILPWEVM